MLDTLTARQEAEDDALAAIAQLPPAAAFEAMTRLQAVLLAGLGIVPGTPAFDRVAIAYLATLAEQTADMGKALRATTH